VPGCKKFFENEKQGCLRCAEKNGFLFELVNHLGNVLVTISDRKVPNNTTLGQTITYFKPVVITANDYYPFGMIMPGRNYNAPSAKDYKYGFNGKENDNEVKGEGNMVAFEARIYDSRLGKFLSRDPKTAHYPFQTPYAYHRNSPVNLLDYLGMGDPPGDPEPAPYSPDGKTLIIPSYAVIIDRLTPNAKTDGGTPIIGANGGVNKFSVADKTYIALYVEGKFTHFADASDLSKQYEVTDYFEVTEHKVGFWGRVWGGVRGIGGLFQAGVAAGAAVTTSGLGTAAAVVVGANGIDNAYAGFATAFTGDYHVTFTEKALMSAGVSAEGASFINMSIGILGGSWAAARAGTGFRQLPQASPPVTGATQYLAKFTPKDPFDVSRTLYRGTTGSEVGSSALFLTDDAAVAATYVKNGGQVMQYSIPMSALKELEYTGDLILKTGKHGVTGVTSIEYMFQGKNLVDALNTIAKPFK
jgi:RHS repeat-associated protein